jgi:hypothetical protein
METVLLGGRAEYDNATCGISATSLPIVNKNMLHFGLALPAITLGGVFAHRLRICKLPKII